MISAFFYLGRKALAVITISKLVGLPIIATFLIMIYSYLGWINDPLIGFVIFCSSTAPTALSMVAAATLKKDPVNFVILLFIIISLK